MYQYPFAELPAALVSCKLTAAEDPARARLAAITEVEALIVNKKCQKA